MICPKCHCQETLLKKTLPMVLFLGEGVDIEDSDYDAEIPFEDTDPAECSNCDWKGTFGDLLEKEDQLPEKEDQEPMTESQVIEQLASIVKVISETGKPPTVSAPAVLNRLIGQARRIVRFNRDHKDLLDLYRTSAKADYEDEGELEFDDEAVVSIADCFSDAIGAYVACWRWVRNEDAGVTTALLREAERRAKSNA